MISSGCVCRGSLARYVWLSEKSQLKWTASSMKCLYRNRGFRKCNGDHLITVRFIVFPPSRFHLQFLVQFSASRVGLWECSLYMPCIFPRFHLSSAARLCSFRGMSLRIRSMFQGFSTSNPKMGRCQDWMGRASYTEQPFFHSMQS